MDILHDDDASETLQCTNEQIWPVLQKKTVRVTLANLKGTGRHCNHPIIKIKGLK